MREDIKQCRLKREDFCLLEKDHGGDHLFWHSPDDKGVITRSVMHALENNRMGIADLIIEIVTRYWGTPSKLGR